MAASPSSASAQLVVTLVILFRLCLHSGTQDRAAAGSGSAPRYERGWGRGGEGADCRGRRPQPAGARALFSRCCRRRRGVASRTVELEFCRMGGGRKTPPAPTIVDAILAGAVPTPVRPSGASDATGPGIASTIMPAMVHDATLACLRCWRCKQGWGLRTETGWCVLSRSFGTRCHGAV